MGVTQSKKMLVGFVQAILVLVLLLCVSMQPTEARYLLQSGRRPSPPPPPARPPTPPPPQYRARPSVSAPGKKG
ncbi:hypothetical protein LINGRAHAP2_LOCUS11389 [Linum grandiflorum]